MDNTVSKNQKIFVWLVWAVVLTGIGLRIWIYLQNRNLMLDEANVARNIYERGFLGLLHPLSYEQYAPPVFLWMLKGSSMMFGFGEMALRIYPFLCGLASVYVLYRVLKEYVSIDAVWLPLMWFATGYLFIRYGTELKQYSSDVLIALSLVWLALRTPYEKTNRKRFLAVWIVAGSIAIWASMPSVFVLAGVGAYYIWPLLKGKQYSSLGSVAIAAAVWVVQFLVYYIKILKPQANSPYLQNFHRDFFLHITPDNYHEWRQNWWNIKGLFIEIGNQTFLSDIFIVTLLVTAIIIFIKNDFTKGLLLLVPVACLFIAAFAKQFSLIPRVSLFGIVLMIIICGYGFNYLIHSGRMVVRVLVIITGIIIAGCNIERCYEKGFRYEELTKGMDYVKQHHVVAKDLYIYHSSAPAYLYYTNIHPDNKKWETIKDADIMQWQTNYDSLSWLMQNIWETKGPFVFLYTNATPEEFAMRRNDIKKWLKETEVLNDSAVKCCIYMKK
ncbi:MAG: glycosyltransferase family 39 protein [Bacteroidetes bacterium]|nr:glycosyltransferase family 39 protein [Bacteroidota bacterium]